MKLAVALLLVVMVVAIISGCVQEPTGPPTGGLTEKQIEDQAFSAVEKEMEDAIDSMTMEDFENELLQEG
ncbi:MAG: hypothetical protein JSV39_00380 [Candidatus Aenigmatarchaeota archaeon]|nr:MAG: hypothetical protein JSV39_00380 [Candidatus Aenigmarchaeota archaeon]